VFRGKSLDMLRISKEDGRNGFKCYKLRSCFDHSNVFSLGKNDAFWVVSELLD
jgi:hypothetical protein